MSFKFTILWCVFSFPLMASTSWLTHVDENLDKICNKKEEESRKRLDDKTEVVRSRLVYVDFNQLLSEADQGHFTFNLFDDINMEGVVRFTRKFKDNQAVYSGDAQFVGGGSAMGQFTLTTYKGFLAMQVQMGRMIFVLRGITANGLHLVQELDALSFPGGMIEKKVDKNFIPPYPGDPHNIAIFDDPLLFNEKTPTPDLGWEDEASVDNGNTFDVLAVYTSATLAIDADIVSISFQFSPCFLLENSPFFSKIF